jgi:DNA repair protein RadC
LRSGEHTLSNTELLAILLRTGIKGNSAIDLARKILHKFKTFRNMSHTSIQDWNEFKGIGKAKLSQIRAAVEIARRYNLEENTEKKQIKLTSTEHIVDLFKARMRDIKYEIFKVILCTPRNNMIDVIEIDQGTPIGSYPVIRDIVEKALQNFASGVVCLHNHPGGDSKPSREDEQFTRELDNVMRTIDIKFLDHIIFGENDYYSFDKKMVFKYNNTK